MITNKVKEQLGEQSASTHRQPECVARTTRPVVGESLLHAALAVILIGLAILLNSAIRETIDYFRAVLST